MSSNQSELYSTLPQEMQDAIQDEGYCPESVMEYAEMFITELMNECSNLEKEGTRAAQKEVRDMVLMYNDLKAKHDRMLKVLTEIGAIVTSAKDGSFTVIEDRPYNHGKNVLANQLYKILMEKE